MARRRRDSETDRATLAPGQLAVPNVRLVRKIAEGGMGSVWEGEHAALRTSVAVKFVLDEFGHNAEAAARFDREATAAARIKSPHVVQVLDHGVSDEGVAYIVMELLEGQDLEARLNDEPKLPLELVAHIVVQSSKALEKAHGLGIVHRDIKPSNVYLTDVGGEIFVKILDFGIAKLSIGMGEQMRMTQTGAMIGTPVFMAPEQMTQAKDVGPPADMWSMAVVAYVALTGKLPYESDTIAGLAVAIERGVFPAATSIVPGLPAGIDAWFEKALHKDPSKRFASMREMGDSIARLAGVLAPSSALSSTRSTSTPPPPGSTSEPPAAKDLGGKSADDEKTTVRGTPHSRPPPSGDDAGATSALAATVNASPSPWGSHATIMGASSEKARQEARSGTRAWVLASVAIVLLGGAAAFYGVLRSGEDPAATTSASGPPASASAFASASALPGVPSAAQSAAPAASAMPSSVLPSASSASPSASASASIKAPEPPPFKPPPYKPPPPKPPTSGSATAAPKPPASAGAAPTTTTKPPASTAPPASAKPPAPPPPKPAPAPK